MSHERVVRIGSRRRWFQLNLVEVWHYRDVLRMLALRSVKLRYKQTGLGIAWVILQPLLTSAIMAVVFGHFAKLPSGEAPYFLTVFTAMLPWSFFSQVLQRGSTSLVRDQNLVTKVYVPRVIIPLSNMFCVVVDFSVASAFLLGALLVTGQPFTWRLLTIPILLLVVAVLAIGVVLILAALNVFYRDVQYALPFMIQFMMYASPVAYTMALVPEKWSVVYSLNPMVGIVEAFRWAALGSSSAPAFAFTYSCVVAALVLVSGLIFFRRLERGFADMI